MDKNQIISIVTTCILSAGGVGGIVVAIIKFISKHIADILFSKYEGELQKGLELYKSTLDSSNYISKAMFEKEFEIYLNFNKVFSILYNDIQLYHGIIKSGKHIISIKDALKNDFPINIDTETITEIQIDCLEKSIYNNWKNLREQLGYIGAFIPHENWILLQETCNSCHTYMLTKSEEDFNKIIISMGKMQHLLRKHLQELTILS